MARKQRSGDSTDVYFDTRTKAVLTQTSHNSMANLKEQLAGVREVVPHVKNEDIILVLQHFDGDVQKTIQAFMEDGAEEILKEWNIPNKRKTGNNVNKKNKKKRSKQQTAPQEDGIPDRNGKQEEDIPSNNNIDESIESKMEATRSAKVGGKQSTSLQPPKPVSAVTTVDKPTHREGRQQSTRSVDSPKQQRKPQQHLRGNNRKDDTQSVPTWHSGSKPQEPREYPVQAQSQTKNPRQGPARAGQQQYSNKPASGPTLHNRTGKDLPGQRSSQVMTPKQGQSSEDSGRRERNISESSSVTDPSRSKKSGATLDKSSKDLQRTEVSLTRHKNLLAEEIEKAEKRLKKAFDDARTCLSTREEDLIRHLQEVKRHATSLLEDRQHKAFELKQEISRVVSKSDQELQELRADIKHFVSERKIDEEIGRSSRFTGNPDALQEAIKTFGEVLTVKNVYSERRRSLTSLTSMDSLSRPTSISDDHGGLLSRSASTLEGSVKNGHGPASVPATPTTPTSPDDDMDSDVAMFAAKMQRSMQGQRGRGPRNPRQQADGARQGQQGSNPRLGQSAKGGIRQDQRGNRGRQDANNQNANNQNKRVDDKLHNETAQQGRRNERRRNDRGDSGWGKEEPRNKDRIIRRRESYRRRHDQGSDIKPEVEAGKDVKKDTRSVQRPDSIPIRQNGPSPASVDKKPGVNDSIPVAKSNNTEKPKPQVTLSQSIKPQTADANGTEKSKPQVTLSQSIKPQTADANGTEKSKPQVTSSQSIKPQTADANGTEKSKPQVTLSQSIKPQTADANGTEQPKPQVTSSQSFKPQAAVANHTEKSKPQALPAKTKAQVSDVPLVNGTASSSVQASPTEALPQRKPREERNRKKVEEVVKEVTSLNGMTNGEAPAVMVNGES